MIFPAVCSDANCPLECGWVLGAQSLAEMCRISWVSVNSSFLIQFSGTPVRNVSSSVFSVSVMLVSNSSTDLMVLWKERLIRLGSASATFPVLFWQIKFRAQVFLALVRFMEQHD